MKAHSHPYLVASVVAIAATFGLFGGAYLVSGSHEQIAHALYWQGYWLQSLVPAANVGTPEHPLYEGNMGHVVAFFAGVPLGLLIYFLLALAVLHLTSGHSAAQPGTPADVSASASLRQKRG